MEKFILKHQDKIESTLSCFDRLVFHGHLPVNHCKGFEEFLSRHGILFKELKSFMTRQADRLKKHAQDVAQRAGRPYEYFGVAVRKEQLARAIAKKDGITEGLVCVFSTLEPCHTYRMAYGHGRPRILPAKRKCLTLYFYFIDRQFGLIHIRIQTWFPFTVQIYLNGHEYVTRKMDQHGLGYRQVDNAFTWLENPKRAQRFADGLVRKNWPRILGLLARRVTPLLKDLFVNMSYYWVTHQSELATDILFKNPGALKELYPRLVKHATLCFSAEDILAFLGRKLHGRLEAEVHNHLKKRIPGTRVKHRMRYNWIKMVDKHGLVLRVETVINQPADFHVRRRVRRRGTWVTQCCPMRKGVANLFRYVEVSLAANRRYLDSLGVVDDPTVAVRQLREITRPAHRNGRRVRALNPTARVDLDLFRAVMRGEHAIIGFRNADVRRRLFLDTDDAARRRRQSAKVTRLLQRLHLHRLIAKVPRSRRWRVTQRGQTLMAAALKLHDVILPDLVMEQAA